MNPGMIPDEAQEELYQLARLALTDNDLMNGLLIHFRQTSLSLDLVDESEQSFTAALKELNRTSLVDLFHETTVSNGRYDPVYRQFYIDPQCTQSYALDGLYAHFYQQKLGSLLMQHGKVDKEALKRHLTQTLSALETGRPRIESTIGGFQVEIIPSKGAVNIRHGNNEVKISAVDKADLEAALSSWQERIKVGELEYTDEACAL